MPAPKGHKFNEKTTEEELIIKFQSMYDYIKQNSDVYFKEQVWAEFDTYRDQVRHWLERFDNDHIIPLTNKKINNILISRKLVGGSVNSEIGTKLNPTMTIFSLKSSHGFIEEDKKQKLQLEEKKIKVEEKVADAIIKEDKLKDMTDEEKKALLDKQLE